MIEPIRWPARTAFDKVSLADQVDGRLASPFDENGFSRPLRITYDYPGLQDISEDQREALHILESFSEKPLIEALQLGDGDFLPIHFRETVEGVMGGLQKVEVNFGDTRLESAVHTTSWLQELAKELASEKGLDGLTGELIYDDLVAAHSSLAMGQDIFVTTAKSLIENRSHHLIAGTNPRTPLETLRILGFLMRARSDYRYANWGRCNRTLYYQMLTHARIPALWRYVNVFLHRKVEPAFRAIPEVAASVMSRCLRAIEAYDAIARVFYRQNTIDTEESMMYHFDYLTLLLAGALDSQALIAYRLLGLTQPDERNVNFRNRPFLNELARCAGGLAALMRETRAEMALNLLADLRNTIHRERLHLLSADQLAPDVGRSLVYLAERHARKSPYPSAWDICKLMADKPRWGIVEDGRHLWIEPFTFASTLLERCFGIVSDVIRNTDLSAAFPGKEVAELEAIPAEFQALATARAVRRFQLLG